jgi:phosphoinositide 3-kinase adaptor protein 1
LLKCFADEQKVDLPTVLHLSAKYGLNELASRLIDLPDARYAYCIPNTKGHYPEDLARGGGHQQLAAVLENYREVVSIVLLTLI